MPRSKAKFRESPGFRVTVRAAGRQGEGLGFYDGSLTSSSGGGRLALSFEGGNNSLFCCCGGARGGCRTGRANSPR